MFEIPQKLTIKGEEFAIRNKGDFRMVLDCFDALEDNELTKEEKILSCLIIFYDGMNDIEDLNALPDMEEAIKKMYRFFNCGQTESPGKKVNYKLIDWKQDSQLVCSAINNVAGKEIRLEPYLHWWTFMGYFMAIGESPLSTIVTIRNKIVKHKKLEKYEREFQRDNPEYFNIDMRTQEAKEAEEIAKQLWNNGK